MFHFRKVEPVNAEMCLYNAPTEKYTRGSENSPAIKNATDTIRGAIQKINEPTPENQQQLCSLSFNKDEAKGKCT